MNTPNETPGTGDQPAPPFTRPEAQGQPHAHAHEPVLPEEDPAEAALEQAGTHPLGTALGAIGGAAAGALIGIAAGPVGSLAGAVGGAIAGGLLGSGAVGSAQVTGPVEPVEETAPDAAQAQADEPQRKPPPGA